MIGNVSNDIAMGVSIIRVKIAIAAGGSPIPRKPLIVPANKNAPMTISNVPMSEEGNRMFEMNASNAVVR